VDLGFIAYDIYRILVDNVFDDCDNLDTNLASLGGDLVGLALPGVTGLGLGARGARKGTVVIGKLEDLASTSLKTGESILDWTRKATPQLNWQENSRLLRETIAEGLPIRDASVNAITGALEKNTGFLRAERNLLENQGWKFSTPTGYWHPPGVK
jgi:hypothetical protein